MNAKTGFHQNEGGISHFWAWQYDRAGPGGLLKGFAHAGYEPPQLVASIDENSSDPYEQKTLYRRIKGDWYLFYLANN